MQVRSDAKQLTDIAAQVDAGTVKLDIGARFPLAELARVHAESATLRGKTVITI